MSVLVNEAAYNDAYCRRIKECREAKGWTQQEMADSLGLPLARYQKYEIRSPLPQYLIEHFSRLTDRDVHYVVTGKHARRIVAPTQPAVRRAG